MAEDDYNEENENEFEDYDEEGEDEEQVPKKKSNLAQWLLIGVIVVLLIINGVQLYLHTQNKEQIETQTVTIENKEKQLERKIASIDSLKAEVQKRIKKIEALGDTATELRGKVTELENVRAGLQKNVEKWKGSYYSLKRDIDKQLKAKDQRIDELEDVRDSLYAKTDTLKQNLQANKDTISDLKRTQDELSDKVNTAEALQAANADIYAMKKLGSGRYDKEELRGWRIDKMVFEFDILKNKIAPVGERTFYLRIVDPDDAAMYDLDDGSGTFDFEGREIYYTMQQTEVYEKEKLHLKYQYQKDKWEKEGEYKVELYCDSNKNEGGAYKLGESSFKVK